MDCDNNFCEPPGGIMETCDAPVGNGRFDALGHAVGNPPLLVALNNGVIAGGSAFSYKETFVKLLAQCVVSLSELDEWLVENGDGEISLHAPSGNHETMTIRELAKKAR